MNMKMKQPQLLPLGFFWFLLVNGAIEMAGQQQVRLVSRISNAVATVTIRGTRN